MWLSAFLGLGFGIVGVVLVRTFLSHPKQEMAFWRSGLVIVAAIYLAFWLLGNRSGNEGLSWLGIESLGMVIYGLMAWASKRITVWLLPIGWLLHGLWDLLLHAGGHPAFVPNWYPAICLGFDVCLFVYLSWLIWSPSSPGIKKSANPDF
ncbi:MAG: hypothetical protein AAF206_27700 [Bacteroidota bacterium]